VPFRPHDDALFVIGSVLSEQRRKLNSLYVQAALGYAYGAAWAILRVLDGQHPDTVELGRTPQGEYIIPGELCPVPSLMPKLQRWNGYEKFVCAHARWAQCDMAAAYADYLDEQSSLTDHEAGELDDAIDSAAGLPDAAYAYGVLAESGLAFALLDAKAEHARTRA
jgi:hypothetical protein